MLDEGEEYDYEAAMQGLCFTAGRCGILQSFLYSARCSLQNIAWELRKHRFWRYLLGYLPLQSALCIFRLLGVCDSKLRRLAARALCEFFGLMVLVVVFWSVFLTSCMFS